MQKFFQDFITIFTEKKYIECFAEGIKLTLIVSLCAALFGLILGTISAFIKISPKKHKFSPLHVIADIYTTVIRGTPMTLQLFIMAFVIITVRGFPREITAVLAFGINSGAYVSENIRAGILSVDIGQTEAGRSLGLSHKQVMRYIVMPQAIKNIIPAIGNELIALIKETSILSMIGMYDLTAAAKNVGGGNNLAGYFAPMSAAAVFYLIIVYALAFAVKKIEKRLRASDKR